MPAAAQRDIARVDFKLPPGKQLSGSGGTLLFSLSQAGIETLPDDWEGDDGDALPAGACHAAASFLDDNDPTEVLCRSYALALDDFVAVNPSLDVDSIAMISLVFDGSEKGAIIMDDISTRAAPVADHAASASPLVARKP